MAVVKRCSRQTVLKVLLDENGVPESMLQHMFRMLKGAGLSDRAMIATNAAQLDFIRKQVGDEVPVLVEPQRRDTFPAISLAASYLYSVQQADLSETVAVIPVDLMVGTDFFHALKALDEIITSSDEAEIGLIGIRPDHPSTNYGYIIPDLQTLHMQCAYRIDRFVEKPDAETAKALIEQKAMWNSGVFVFKLSCLIQLLESRNYPVQFDHLLAAYESMPKISFDYEVVEKASHLVVLPYNGAWKDIGTWKSLTEMMETEIVGKGVMCEECRNTHIVNELDIPVAVVGLSDVIVAACPDGILVSDKNASSKIKNMISGIMSPMLEDHPWGWSRLLDQFRDEKQQEITVKRVYIRAGHHLGCQLCGLLSETWNIMSGECEFALGSKKRKVTAGDVLQIPANARRTLKAITDAELIVIQKGAHLTYEDTASPEEDWEENTRQWAIQP
jgi:mannose-1-phosphate guanylyltransferase